jgi:hypothetical protein
MSMKIEGSNQPLQSESEVQAPVASAPLECVDRVEQACVEERAYAGERSFAEGQLHGLLEKVPSPGALELEVAGKFHHNGGKMKVTAERDASGGYLVRVEGKAVVGVPGAATVGAGVGGSATYRVRTPEAAADLLHALMASAVAPQPALLNGEAMRTTHYTVQNLERVELNVRATAGGQVGIVQVLEGEVGHKASATIDFDKHLLITEQAAEGEVLHRGSVLMARAGVELEGSFKLRTETELPDDVLAKLASGELSFVDVMRKNESTRKLVFEGEERSDVHTLFAKGYSQVIETEVELDLDQLASDPLEPRAALSGHIKTMMSNQQAVGIGMDLLGVSVLARGAIYSVNERHLFEAHDDKAMQNELDLKRSLH